MLPVMSASAEPNQSAPEAEPAEKQETPALPRRGRRRRTLPVAAPDPSKPKSEEVVARARQLLEKLVRSAGYGWRDIDRMIHKNRGFTSHLLSKREGLPLNDILSILDALDVRHEDFFSVLYPKFDKPRFSKPLALDVADLLDEAGVPDVPRESEAEVEARSREVWGRLDRINALIDQRVLDLMEKALGEPAKLPPRPAGPAAEAEEPAAEATAAQASSDRPKT